MAKDFKVSGVSQSDLVTSIYHEQLRIYGVQFHPEVDLTPNGKQMISNFLFEISKLSPNFTMAGRKEECIKYIRDKVGNNKVLVSTFSFLSVLNYILGVAGTFLDFNFSNFPQNFLIFFFKYLYIFRIFLLNFNKLLDFRKKN